MALRGQAGVVMPAPTYGPSAPDSSFQRKLCELDAQIQDAQRAVRAPVADPFCPRWFVACDPFPSLWHFPSAVPRAPIAPASHQLLQARELLPSVREYEPPGTVHPPAQPAPAGAAVAEKPPVEATEATFGSRKPSKRRKGNRSNHRG